MLRKKEWETTWGHMERISKNNTSNNFMVIVYIVGSYDGISMKEDFVL